MLKLQTESGRQIQAYTIDEVAEKLDVHLMTVRRWVDGGKLHPVPGQSCLLFAQSEVRGIKKYQRHS